MTVLDPASPRAVATATASSYDEPALVRAAADGDDRAFEQLVHAHSRRVMGYLMQLVRNRHDAQDITQQTFIKAYRHLAAFDCERPLINWLLTIARRTALNHFRDTKTWEEAPDNLVSAEPSPALALEHAERKETLWTRARRLLSEREYEVLWLRFGEEMSIEETARIMNLTRVHVKVIVFRARHRLSKGEPAA